MCESLCVVQYWIKYVCVYAKTLCMCVCRWYWRRCVVKITCVCQTSACLSKSAGLFFTLPLFLTLAHSLTLSLTLSPSFYWELGDESSVVCVVWELSVLRSGESWKPVQIFSFDFCNLVSLCCIGEVWERWKRWNGKARINYPSWFQLCTWRECYGGWCPPQNQRKVGFEYIASVSQMNKVVLSNQLLQGGIIKKWHSSECFFNVCLLRKDNYFKVITFFAKSSALTSRANEGEQVLTV